MGRQTFMAEFCKQARPCGPEANMAKLLAADASWAAASTFTTMTAADPVASRLLDRTGVCGARRGAPSAGETTIGQGLPSPYQPDKGRSAIYRTD